MNKREIETKTIPTNVGDLFHYNPNTGNLIWKINIGKRARVGNVVGGKNHPFYAMSIT